jgi:hypothetical protein
MEFALKSGCPIKTSAAREASKGASAHVLEWLIENGCDWVPWMAVYAVRNKNWEVLDWSERNELPFESFFGPSAMMGTGDLERIQRFASKPTCNITQMCFEEAATQGHVHVLEWLRETYNLGDTPQSACVLAAGRGHVHVLEWIEKNTEVHFRQETINLLLRNSAFSGSFECFKWGLKHGAKPDLPLSLAAARWGRFEILKVARENGCPWNEKVCSLAASNGDLEMLRWAREQVR